MKSFVLLILLLCFRAALTQAQTVGVLIISDPIPGNMFCQTFRWTTITEGAIASYQWFISYDTVNPRYTAIPNSSTPTLTVNQSGLYQVVVTSVDGVTAVSQTTGVLFGLPVKAEISTPKHIICPGETVPLTMMYQNTTLQWFLNGQSIPGATQPTYQATESGTYTVSLTDPAGCSVVSVPQSMTKTAAPTGKVTGLTQLCDKATNVLILAGAPTGSGYQWLHDAVPIGMERNTTYQATQPGTYQVLITDANQCTGLSGSLTLTGVGQLAVALDSIPPQCIDQATVVPLTGSPAGGVFSGSGVVGNQFDPRRAGTGRHDITYTIAGATACQSGVAHRFALVNPAPTAVLPPTVSSQPGSAVVLGEPAQAGYQYRWTPPTGLDNPASAMPKASPDSSTTYTLEVRNSFGCAAEAHTRVLIRSTVRLYVPDAFTPNNDGYDDVWSIRNAEAYPEIEVTIYNRWGIAVFYSKGYQTPFNGQDLPPAEYTYKIVYDSPGITLLGRLLLLR